VVPDSFVCVDLDSAAERDTSSKAYLVDICDALRWYLRASSAFTSISPRRETHRQRRTSAVSVML
jgi:hypothetical protein